MRSKSNVSQTTSVMIHILPRRQLPTTIYNFVARKMFKNISQAIIVIRFNLCLLSGIHGPQNDDKLITNGYWINLISHISKQTKNEINILINDAPPYSMLNKKGSDVITLRTILAKLKIKVFFTRTKELARVSEEYLE